MDAEDPLSHPLPPLNKATSLLSLDEGISWFHGKITRDAADHILTTSGKEEGLFLVRESSSSPGDYVLSLIQDGEPVHYQIRRHGEDAFFSIDGGPVVHGLEMLISHFEDNEHGQSTKPKLTQMCKAQPPPSDTRRHGRTNLLHRATKEGNLTVVRELLRSGYHNLDAKNQEGQTAIHLSSMTGFDDILDLLLEVGANPNILDGSGLAPLHYACQNNHSSTVKVLLKHGANPQLRADGSGWVPLHVAADSGFTDTVKLLLEINAPCHPRSSYNETPLDLAMKNNHQDCVSLIQNHEPQETKSSKSDWFHEDIDRERTSELFNIHGLQDGMFLVRRSARRKEVYVLSMVHNAQTFNYEIQRKENFYFIDDGPYFESLDRVVHYYSQLPDGLPTNLVHAIPPEPNRKKSNSITPETTVENAIYDNVVNIVNNNGNENSHTTAKAERSIRPNLIRRESLCIGQTVGEGEFGSVLRAKWINQNKVEIDVAVKMMRDEHVQSCRDEFIREVEVMVGLNHSCIVKLLGVCLGPPLMMIQELLPMGSLLDYILDYPHQVNVQNMYLWSAQIAWGMTYLESKRFVHRDLAARNILLATKTQAKISDFGLSRALGAESEYYRASTGGRWPVKWYAPESINFGTFSHASDVWGYGITLWEIFTYGDAPYGEMTGTQVISLLEANQRLEIPKNCPEKISLMMQQCWMYDPEKRPTFSLLYSMFCTDPEYAFLWEHINKP